MDAEDSDPFEGPVYIPDQDSGSDYEHSGSDFDQETGRESPDAEITPNSPQLGIRNAIPLERESDAFPIPQADPTPNNPYTEEWIRADALKWAATFVPPKVEDIPIPERKGGFVRPQKRKSKRYNGTSIRLKRFKGLYSHEYRELLNIDIHDAVQRSIDEDSIPVEGSQIGSSIWTAQEKDSFFAGLSRLGKDNVKAIAAHVSTKSEIEVQEYIQLLDRTLLDKKASERHLMEATDYPSAIELTSDCCATLEQAADAIAARQERWEEDVERSKWGEHWLLTRDVCDSLEKKRNMAGGEGTIDEILPAANLLNLKNWPALSTNVFMNASEARSEDNWRSIGEKRETPAIRATAFEDFHSLAVNITKRLVSTILFCTMSRRRATSSQMTKSAEINASDVGTAVKILKLDANSNNFWIRCARRNNLAIVDQDYSSAPVMTYEDVETALRKEDGTGQKSRSRSRSRPLHSKRPLPDSDTSSETSYSITDSVASDLETDLDEIDNASPTQSQHQPQHLSAEAYECALESHISAFDARTAALEEQRIWKLLRQVPPHNAKNEEGELVGKPKAERKDLRLEEGGQSWRSREVWSEWEMDGVIKEEEFMANERRMERRKRRKTEKRRLRERRRKMGGGDGGLRSEEYVVESGSDGDVEEDSGAEEMGAIAARDELDSRRDRDPQVSLARRSYAVYNSDDE